MKSKIILCGSIVAILTIALLPNCKAPKERVDKEKPRLVIPIGHVKIVNSAEFSQSSKLVVTSSADETAKIWDVKSGRLIRTLDGLPFITFAQFSPDANYIVTNGITEDLEDLQIWETNSGKLLYALNGHKEVKSIQFASNGKTFLTDSNDSTAKIWEVNSGHLIATMRGHSGFVNSARFSPDERYVITSSRDSTARIWDINSGHSLYSLGPNNSSVSYAEFSPDTKLALTTSEDRTVRIWETASGKLQKTIHLDSSIMKAQFSPDGTHIVICTNPTVQIWEVASAKLEHSIQADGEEVVYSPDGRFLITTTSYYGTIKIWEATSGALFRSVDGYNGKVNSVRFSPDGKFIVSCGSQPKIWETISGNLMQSLSENALGVNSAKLSQDCKSIAVAYDDNSAKIWEVSSGTLQRTMRGHSGLIYDLQFSLNSRYIYTISWDHYLKMWETGSGKLLYSFKINTEGAQASFSADSKYIVIWEDPIFVSPTHITVLEVNSGKTICKIDESANFVQFHPSGKYIITASGSAVKLWDATSGELLRTFQERTDNTEYVRTVQFNPDGKYAVSTSEFGAVKIWETSSAKLIETLQHFNGVLSAEFSSDSKFVVTTTEGSVKGSIDTFRDTLNIWDAASGKLVKAMAPISALGGSTAQFSPDSKTIFTFYKYGNYQSGGRSTLKLWDAGSGNLLHSVPINGGVVSLNLACGKVLVVDDANISIHDLKSLEQTVSWVALDSVDWVVTHPSGLFDASPGAMDKIYFVQGLDIIDLAQLKERYFEPGLWRKAINGEKLRDVTSFNSIELPPEIKAGSVNEKGELRIELTNKGGGIGEVTVLLNGKEIIKDAREPGTNTNLQRVSLDVQLSGNKAIIPGQENYVAVKAWNAGHWIVSKGQVVVYNPPGKADIQPSIYIVACGISNYTGEEIDLKYASKDAAEIAKALEFGAKRLFGETKSFVYLLTTDGGKENYPNKANILKTFNKIAAIAKPSDILVVYLSGHGIDLGGQDGDFYYLTQDAYSAASSAYSDPAIRQLSTLSSAELVELFKNIAALKQVFIIDACGSGKVVDNLIAQKSLPSSTLRALDRMKDRTGIHIITGCASDAISYEASRYGQGVLTYSLLEGIRGAALRDEQFVDVNRLFQYAEERVPVLASGIGGIQTPMTFSPNGSQSFDIGQLSDVEKSEVPIAKIRPVYIRSNFQDESELEDVLDLGKKVDQQLNDASSKGTEAPLIFVDVREYPEGCKLVGRYKKKNGKIVLKLKRRCEGNEITIDMTGSDAVDLANQIVRAINN